MRELTPFTHFYNNILRKKNYLILKAFVRYSTLFTDFGERVFLMCKNIANAQDLS